MTLSLGDELLLEDVYSTPEIYIEGIIDKRNDFSKFNEFAIIADHCFNYYVNGVVDQKLRQVFSDEGIKKYFAEKRFYLMDQMSRFNPIPGGHINFRPSLQAFLQYFANPSAPTLANAKFPEIPAEVRQWLCELKTKETSNFERRARKNRRSIRQLLESIYQIKSKVLILRIDLWYDCCAATIETNKEVPKLNLDNIDYITSDRDKFVKYLRGTYKDKLLGFVWKLEYGYTKGYHLHFLIMLDGQAHCQDVRICQSLGEHWRNEITNKQGGYYNCNAFKSKYRKLAIGMTSYADEEKKSAIEEIVKYMTKNDFLFQVNAGDDHRSLGRSGLLRPPANKKGRKRLIAG